jgi:hypothetical protein
MCSHPFERVPCQNGARQRQSNPFGDVGWRMVPSVKSVEAVLRWCFDLVNVHPFKFKLVFEYLNL